MFPLLTAAPAAFETQSPLKKHNTAVFRRSKNYRDTVALSFARKKHGASTAQYGADTTRQAEFRFEFSIILAIFLNPRMTGVQEK